MKIQVIVLLLLAAGSVMAQQNEHNRNQEKSTTADFISRLDKDGDGKIAKSEFDGPAEHFKLFDINSDGYISISEVPKGPPSKKKGPPSGEDCK